MRRLPLTLLALLGCLAAAVGQEAPPPRDPIPWANKFFTGVKDDPPPVILHDFGTLPKGTVRTYRFAMANIYAVPMQIRQAPSPNCGCVSVIEYTGKMNPRETGHIDIKIDTTRVDGPKQVRLDVMFEGRDPRTHEPFFSTAKLEVRAVSRPDIKFDPGVVAFGLVPAGRRANQVVRVAYYGRQPGWGITELDFKKDLFDVTAIPVQVRGAKAAYEVTATLKANAPAGLLDEAIVLKTNDPAAPALTLSVTGRVQAPLTLFGTKDGFLRLGEVQVGKKVEQRVTVLSDKAFTVTAVDGQGAGVTVPVLKVEKNKGQVLTVTFAPEKPGPVKQVLTIRTDTGESVNMTVEALGSDPQ
jgi:hypothetical protein